MDLLFGQDPWSEFFQHRRSDVEQPSSTGLWYPRTDLFESEATYQVLMELPGVRKEDVAIDLSPDSVLTIKGKKDREATPGERWHRVERVFGTFSRSFSVPKGVDPAGISASFDNGVLKLVIKKPAPPPQPQTLKINIS
ncbi:heat-shock protein [Pelomyxa schiedti]|nr:heat-shock protein [Pelomyxa schiedti]